jgi:hypothetical protein
MTADERLLKWRHSLKRVDAENSNHGFRQTIITGDIISPAIP